MLGLVEVSRGKPSIYRAVSVETFDAIYRSRVESLRKNALERLKSISAQAHPASREYGVYVLRSWRAFRIRGLEYIRSAKCDVIVCGDSSFVKPYWEELRKKEEEGVNVFVILYELPGIPVREDEVVVRKARKAVSGDMMVVVDSRVALVAQRRLGPGERPEYGLSVEEPVLIDYLEQDFFNRWLRGSVIRDEPVRLPSCFTVNRLALIEAQRLLSEGRRLSLTAYGRYTGSRGEAIVEGIVRDAVVDQATGVAHFVVDTRAGSIRIGGPDAVVEEFAASRIELRGA